MIELHITDERGNTISHQLDLGRHSLGKSSDCDIILMDSFASRHHAELLVSNKGIFIIDAGSKNGIFVNGKRVKQYLKLKEGQPVKIGNLALSIAKPKFKLFVRAGRINDNESIDETVERLLQTN